MKRSLFVSSVFALLLVSSGSALAAPIDILSQNYYLQLSASDMSNSVAFNQQSSTPLTMNIITNSNSPNSSADGVANGGELFVDVYASGFPNPLGGSAYAHAIASIDFRPTVACLMEFTFGGQGFDGGGNMWLAIAGVKTIVVSGQDNWISVNDPSVGILYGGQPYITKLSVDPSVTYTIYTDALGGFGVGGFYGSHVYADVVSAVLEPSSMALVSIGMIGAALLRRRRAKRSF